MLQSLNSTLDHVQELEALLEEAPTTAASHQTQFGVTAADEHTPLPGVAMHNEQNAHSSGRSRPQPTSATQMHGHLTQHHTYPRFQTEAKSPLSSQIHHQPEGLAETQPQHHATGLIEHAILPPQQWPHAVSVAQHRQHSVPMPQQEQNALLQPLLGQPQQPSSIASASQEAAGRHQSNALTRSLQEGAAMAHESCGSVEAGGGSGGGSGRAVAAVHGLSCERPDGKLLFQDVSFKVHPGQLLRLTAVRGGGGGGVLCS